MIRLENMRIDLPGFSIRDVSLTVETGGFFALLGPTGAGKSLVLEAISGLTPVSGGRIWIGDREMTRVPPERRGIGIVYQDSALFPHLNVQKNIVYGLRYFKRDPEDSRKRLDRLVETLNLGHLLHRSVRRLSGGERQRVALARALVVDPDVLLLDEPLSALDPGFREEIRKVLKDLHRETGKTFVMVTHDFAEALFLADRSAVINRGAIEQVGGIEEVFQRPASPFVAGFVGMKNVFEAGFNGSRAHVGDLVMDLEGARDGDYKYVAVRPEDIILGRERTAKHANIWPARILRVDNHGPYYEVSARTGSVTFEVLVAKSILMELGLVEGAEVQVSLDPSVIHLL